MPVAADHFDFTSISAEPAPITHYTRLDDGFVSVTIEKREGRAPKVEIDGAIEDGLGAIDSMISLLTLIRAKLTPAEEIVAQAEAMMANPRSEEQEQLLTELLHRWTWKGNDQE